MTGAVGHCLTILIPKVAPASLGCVMLLEHPTHKLVPAAYNLVETTAVTSMVDARCHGCRFVPYVIKEEVRPYSQKWNTMYVCML
jgi:hypothetical protein